MGILTILRASSGSRNFRGGGEARNMKYKLPFLAAIFFGKFLQVGGGDGPLSNDLTTKYVHQVYFTVKYLLKTRKHLSPAL